MVYEYSFFLSEQYIFFNLGNLYIIYLSMGLLSVPGTNIFNKECCCC